MTTAANAPSPTVKLVRVDADREGQRIDNFLAGQLKGAPRSLIYRLLRTGQVRINGKRAKPESRLSGGDEVRIPPVRLDEPGQVQRPPLRCWPACRHPSCLRTIACWR